MCSLENEPRGLLVICYDPLLWGKYKINLGKEDNNNNYYYYYNY